MPQTSASHSGRSAMGLAFISKRQVELDDCRMGVGGADCADQLRPWGWLNFSASQPAQMRKFSPPTKFIAVKCLLQSVPKRSQVDLVPTVLLTSYGRSGAGLVPVRHAVSFCQGHLPVGNRPMVLVTFQLVPFVLVPLQVLPGTD